MSDYDGLGKGSARVSQGASRQVPEPIVSTAKKVDILTGLEMCRIIIVTFSIQPFEPC